MIDLAQPQTTEDLAREQAVTLATPRRRYGFLARLLFVTMDLLYGRKRTLSKFKVLAIIARAPYQAWEPTRSRSPVISKTITTRFIRWGTCFAASGSTSVSTNRKVSTAWRSRGFDAPFGKSAFPKLDARLTPKDSVIIY